MIRMMRLDEAGAPVGEPIIVDGLHHADWTPDEPDDVACVPVIDVRALRRVNMTIRIPNTRQLERYLFGTPTVTVRRARRHRARIVVVPRRRRKHGRVGVYR